MNSIVIAAMLQSQQVWLPVLHQPASFEKIIAEITFDTKLIAHCEEDQKTFIKDYCSSNSVQILIGPEGDFSHQEITLAINKSYKPVTLGETRLRTETAGVVAAALLLI